MFYIILSVYDCLMVFFFFKQKTAYEMRISDWSSDVCSSDLRIISRETAVVAGVNHAKEIFKLKGCNAIIAKKDGSKVKPNDTIMTITGDAGKKIGRASCRERVCQYV